MSSAAEAKAAAHADLDPALLAFLREPATHGGAPVQHIETHGAHVFLVGARALKLKKPVDFGYMDFSTLEKRKACLDNELMRNRRTAPDIYRAVVPIYRTPTGFSFAGEGPAVEYALDMARFDDACVLARLAENGALTAFAAEAAARMIADFHRRSPLVARDGISGVEFVLQSNARLLRQEGGSFLDPGALNALETTSRAELARLTPLLNARARAGLIRQCHGDLHLGNLFARGDEVIAFDCIEFNDAMTEIDLYYDVGFFWMDLTARGLVDHANRALNAYLEQIAEGADAQALNGLAALPLFISMRAAVRAHVSAAQGRAKAAQLYLDLALAALTPPAPRLVALGGLSGSGKSTFARRIAPQLDRSPGAVILRSDALRKRLWGVAPTQILPAEAYRPDESARVYEVMSAHARAALRAGRSVVLDAAHLRLPERQAAAQLAEEMGVPFTGIWLDAPPAVLADRIAARRGDVSDADLAVLSQQLSYDLGPIHWRRLSGDTAIEGLFSQN